MPPSRRSASRPGDPESRRAKCRRDPLPPREDLIRRRGRNESGWWRYVIPGYGVIDWGVYVARLRRAGINSVISIEHEDAALGREEGFIKGLRFLRQYA